MIGFVSTHDVANEVIERLLPRKGFCTWPNGFKIEPFALNSWGWCDGFEVKQIRPVIGSIVIEFGGQRRSLDESFDSAEELFFLEHTHEFKDLQIVRHLGVFSSFESAEQARQELRALPGFSITDGGFTIDKYIVDRGFAFESGFGVG